MTTFVRAALQASIQAGAGGAGPPTERFHRCQLVLPLDVPVEVGHVVEHEIGTGRREDSLLPGVRSELIDLDNH